MKNKLLICLSTIIPIILMFGATAMVAQNTNRYYPSLKNILSPNEDKKMHTDFNYFNDWIREIAKNVFYKDLQHSGSRNGDASFDSMGLIFKRQNNFPLGNSGFELSFNKGKSDFSIPINIQLEQKFRVLAYNSRFDINSYDPANLKQKYALGLQIFNLSEEQVLAHFLNNFVNVNDNKYDSPLEKFIIDLNKKQKNKIPFDKNNEKIKLKDITLQVVEHTKKSCSDVLYDLYIKSKTSEEEAKKFNQFFRKFTPENASSYIDMIAGYEATIAIPGKEFSLQIPIDVFKMITDDNGSFSTISDAKIEVTPRQIEMKTIQNANQKGLIFTLVVDKNISQASFKALNEIKLNKHIILKDSERKLTIYNVSAIQKLIFSIYKDEIQVEMEITTENWHDRVVVMKQKFSFN